MAEKINGYRSDMAGLGDIPSQEAVNDLIGLALTIGDYSEFRASEVIRPLMYQVAYPYGLYDVEVGLQASARSKSPDVLLSFEKPIDYDADAPINTLSYSFIPTRRQRGVVNYQAQKIVSKYRTPGGKSQDITVVNDALIRRQRKAGNKLAEITGFDVFTMDHLKFIKGALLSLDITELIAERKRQATIEGSE